MNKQYFYVIQLYGDVFLNSMVNTHITETRDIVDAWKFTEYEINEYLDNIGDDLKKIYPNLKILEVECIFRKY